MSTTAAFFVGEGKDAVFLGGHYYDGYPQDGEGRGGVPQSILSATTEEHFRKLVTRHLQKIDDNDRMGLNSWEAAKGVQYIYCFFEGHVWVTTGGRWYNDYIPANIHPSKKTPSPPVNRIGKLGIDIRVQCGQCQNTETLDHKEFDKVEREEWSMTDIYDYFKSKGWKASENQGWLCPEC